MKIKIGLILPSSQYIPYVARDISTSVKLALSNYPDLEYELFIEPGGYNSESELIKEKTQNLIMKNEVDVIICPLNNSLIHHIGGIATANQVPFVVNTLGEDLFFERDNNDFVFVNSFGLWESCWLAGEWAAENIGLKSSTLVAVHDGGYGIGSAFGFGMGMHQGGTLACQVTHRDKRDEDPTEALEFVGEYNSDLLICMYSGEEAISFFDTLPKVSSIAQLPLVTLPFGTDTTLLPELNKSILGSKCVSSWNKENDSSIDFNKEFNKLTGKSAHPYALLAYESANLIATAAQSLEQDVCLPDQLAKALKNVQFDGPRGALNFDESNNEVVPKYYLHEVTEQQDGTMAQTVMKELEFSKGSMEQVVIAKKDLEKQGWTNPYLCA